MREKEKGGGEAGRKLWKEGGRGDLKVQYSHLDHRAEFAGPQPSHILRNGLQRHFHLHSYLLRAVFQFYTSSLDSSIN